MDLLAVALLLPLLGQQPRAAPDRLTPLRTGKEEAVTVLYLDRERVVYADREGEVLESPRRRVRGLAGPHVDYEEFLHRLAAAYADVAEPGSAHAFALWCRDRGFLRDVELACWRELARDPDHAGARALLGHTGGPGAWLVPLGDGRSASWADALRLHAGADLPWKFTTMHWTVEVSGPLDRAVIVAAAAEWLHGRVAGLLREPAELWFLRAPLRLRVWPATPARGPRADAGRPADAADGVDPATGVLHLRFDESEGPARPAGLERGIAELMLTRAAAEMTSSAAEVPTWLTLGLGLLLESSTEWGSGLPSCDLPRLAQETATLQATAAHRLDAGQVAILSASDVAGAHAAVLRAHCASLLHFLLLRDDPKDAAAFHGWLRLALRNRGGGSALREAFGARFSALDAEWRAWIEREGGPRAGERAAPGD